MKTNKKGISCAELLALIPAELIQDLETVGIQTSSILIKALILS